MSGTVFQVSYFNLMFQRAALFEGNLFCVDQYYLPTFILEKELIQYKCNLIQFLSNISEIIPSQKAYYLIDADVISFLY